jgi:pullulanase/glycogen debranching enzyme
MFVMGDEFARTQDGDPNPYDVDGPTTWVDWGRAAEWAELTEFVRRLIAVRRAWEPGEFRFHGVAAEPDLGWNSQSLAWRSGNLYVLANAWRGPLAFGVHEPGDWELVLATAAAEHSGGTVLVPARSIAVLHLR